VSMSGSEGEEALVSASKNGHEAIQEEDGQRGWWSTGVIAHAPHCLIEFVPLALGFAFSRDG